MIAGTGTNILRAGRLSAEVAAPDALGSGVRFDRSGCVTQVWLDASTTFCGCESGGTQGVGLCSEFGLFGPIGFDDAAPGECFIKPGVGLLLRPDDRPYDFARDYVGVPVEISVAASGEAGLRFACMPLSCRGWGVVSERSVQLDPEGLTLTTTLSNVGRRAFAIEEYCHNFLASGSGRHQIEFDQALETGSSSWLEVDARWLRWDAPEEGPRHQALVASGVGPHRWSWRDPGSGRAVTGTCSEPCRRVALFVTPTLVCPETFITAELAPGATAIWWRRFTFAI